MNFPILAASVAGIAAASVYLATRTQQYALTVLAGSAGILLLHSRLYFHFTSDDAYISFRYARNFADGMGLVWNRGEHVEGYSNFLWVVLLAGMSKAGADIVVSARWLGFGLALAGGLGTYALCRELLDGARGRVAGVAAAMLLAASGTWALWAMAGLENSLFGALVLVAVILHLREQEGARPLSGFAWAAVSLARPDGPILFAVSAAFKLAESILRASPDGDAPARSTPVRETLRCAAWAASFALIYVPYFAWRYTTYGWLFPNTYYAKVGSGLDQYSRGLRYAMQFSQEHAAVLLLIVPLALALTSLRRKQSAYVLALVLVWFGASIYVGGDSLVRFRLFTPIMPLFYALIATSAAALVTDLHGTRTAARWATEGAVALAGMGLLVFTLHASADGYGAAGIVLERNAYGDRQAIGRWMHDNLPESTVIAVIPAGTIPYESRLPAIDMLGLNDEHIAHRNLKIGEFPAGHEKYDSDYVLDRKPDIIMLLDVLSYGPWSRANYDAYTASAGLIPAVVNATSNERLFKEYDIRAVEVAPGKWLNLLVRRGSTAVEAKTEPVPR
ncbi:MAG: hypothetical protein HY874_00760 [Chloroflexi bacterium]|nr:hypothetical protein [Chloroflexota bacterium]